MTTLPRKVATHAGAAVVGSDEDQNRDFSRRCVDHVPPMTAAHQPPPLPRGTSLWPRDPSNLDPGQREVRVCTHPFQCRIRWREAERHVVLRRIRRSSSEATFRLPIWCVRRKCRRHVRDSRGGGSACWRSPGWAPPPSSRQPHDTSLSCTKRRGGDTGTVLT